MNDKVKISVYDSGVIEKQMEEIKSIIEKYDNFFYTKNPKETIDIILSEIENKCQWIRDYVSD